MIIGHLPGGYLVAKAAGAMGAAGLFWGIILGSILPDFDMLWFLYVDHGTIHHHEYLTHRPAVWAVVLLIGTLVRSPLLIGIGLGALVHMVLDSIVGSIAWLWPLSEASFPLVVVPATHSNWVLSFLFHWTFAVEICLTLIAAWVFLRAQRTDRKGVGS